MNLNVPTCFTDRYLDGLGRLNARYAATGNRIVEVYGAFQSSVAGSGRPAKYLPGISVKALQEHVGRARDLGIRFNYLVNAPCMNNHEYTPEGRAELRELFDTISAAGVDLVTVSIPLLMELLRDEYPNLTVKASTITYATTVQQVQALVKAGCSKICLDIDCNRNFELLKAMARYGGAELELIGNPTCLLSCAYRFYHNSCAGHGSQTRPGDKGHLSHSPDASPDCCSHDEAETGPTVARGAKAEDGDMPGRPYGGYSLLRCHLDKLTEPAEFIKTPWIRPEDMEIYAEAGIGQIKLAGRGLPEEKLLALAEAYVAGRFDGNLLDLTGWGYWNGFDKTAAGERLQPLTVRVENRALDGFLRFFVEEPYHCQLGCDSCRYCFGTADQVVTWNGSEKPGRPEGALIERYAENLQAALSRETGAELAPGFYDRLRKLWKSGAARQHLEV